MLVGGCTDSVSINESDPLQTEQALTAKKLKFADQIKIHSTIQNDDNDDDDDDDDDNWQEHHTGAASFNTQLIIGLHDPVLTADRLLKRYELLTEYRLLKRYDGQTEVPYAIVGEFTADEDEDIVTENNFELALEEILDELEYDDDVEWVEPDILLRDPTPSESVEVYEGQVYPWNIAQVGSAQGSFNNVDVYLLDSGSYSEDIHLVEELDFIGENATSDGIAHGYHVAGIMAAQDNASGSVGVAPGARVHSFRVLNNKGETTTSIVVQALDEIISRKNAAPEQPMVVNLSFGADTGTTTLNVLDATVQAAVSAGIVVIVSAGNEGIDVATVSPARVEDAITVGSYGPYGAFSSFSNHGPLVDILAPGEDILSSVGVEQPGIIQLSSRSGTSMAAPHVAGAVAAYLQANPATPPALVRDALLNVASSVHSVPPNTTNKAVRLH